VPESSKASTSQPPLQILPKIRQKSTSSTNCRIRRYWSVVLPCLILVGTPAIAAPGVNNAIRSARSYLSIQGFSREGLIEQLSSPYGEGYSRVDATRAVDSLNVNWNEQAVRSARSYLSMQGFSCSGLIEQLSSPYGEKYTASQATYGATRAGAC